MNPTAIPLLLLLVCLSVVVLVARRLLSLAKDTCLEASEVMIFMGLGVVLSLLLVTPDGSLVGKSIRFRLAMVMFLFRFSLFLLFTILLPLLTSFKQA